MVGVVRLRHKILILSEISNILKISQKYLSQKCATHHHSLAVFEAHAEAWV